MNAAFQRQLTQEQQRNGAIRAAFVNQYPSLADQVHQGEAELSCSCPLCVHIRASIADSEQIELLPDATPSSDACWFDLSDLATGIVYRSALITAEEVQQRNTQLDEWAARWNGESGPSPSARYSCLAKLGRNTPQGTI